jgi:iron complex outermembrane receptor protein
MQIQRSATPSGLRAKALRRGLLWTSAIVAVSVGGAFATTASADSLTEVGAVVVTAKHYVPDHSGDATKIDTPLIEVPQSVTVITRDQLDLLNVQNLGMAVRYTAGVVGENYGSDARYDWLTQRGFSPVEYIDGLQAPVGSVSSTGHDIYGAQSVEVLKGPSSVLYGLAPPGGIVNITSRRPQDTFGGSAQVSYGSFNNGSVAGDVTGPINDMFSFRLTSLYRDGGTQADGVNSERFYIAPALTVHIDPNTKLTFLSYYQWDNVKGDGVGFLPSEGVYTNNPVVGKLSPDFNAGDYGYNDFARRQYGIGYDVKHDFNDTLSFEQNMKYFDDHNRMLDIYGAGLATVDVTAPNPVPAGYLPYKNPLTGVVEPGVYSDYTTLLRSSFPFKEGITSFNVDSRFVDQIDSGDLKQTILVGFDIRRYTIQSAYGFTSAPSLDLAHPDHNQPAPATTYPYTYANENQDQYGLYAQDEVKYHNWVLTLGGRQDWVDFISLGQRVSNGAFSYRAGLNYIFESGLAPYIAYSTSFQPVVGTDFGTNAPNKPTTGDEVEGGLKFEPTFLPKDYKIYATAVAYDLTQNNVQVPLTPGSYLDTQEGQVEVRGLELEGVARINERLTINASYTYTDSDVTKALTDPPLGKQLTLTPKDKASILVDYTFQTGPVAGLGGGLGVRYISSTFGDTANQWKDPAYTLVDAVLHYDFNKWRVSVEASNLFDHIYISQCSSESDCFYGLRRNVIATVTRKF